MNSRYWNMITKPHHIYLMLHDLVCKLDFVVPLDILHVIAEIHYNLNIIETAFKEIKQEEDRVKDQYARLAYTTFPLPKKTAKEKIDYITLIDNLFAYINYSFASQQKEVIQADDCVVSM